MKKRGIIVLLGLIVLVSFVLAYVGADAHLSDKVLIKVNEYSMTLQEAVDGGFLTQYSEIATQNLTTGPINTKEYHLGSEVYIVVNGQNMTLNQASDLQDRLCSSNPSGSYIGEINFGHSGDEINIKSTDSVTKSLQQAINNGDFCCQPDTCEDLGKECGVHDNGCQGTINCGGCEEDNYACNEDGFCRLSCNDECSSGSTRCLNGDTRQTCGDYDSDLCLEWGNSLTCTGCKTCSGGSCVDNDNQCGDYEECNNGVCVYKGMWMRYRIDYSGEGYSSPSTYAAFIAQPDTATISVPYSATSFKDGGYLYTRGDLVNFTSSESEYYMYFPCIPPCNGRVLVTAKTNFWYYEFSKKSL